MKKKLIFDMDGTLFDTMELWYDLIDNILKNEKLIQNLEPLETHDGSMVHLVYEYIKSHVKDYEKNKVLRHLHNYFVKEYENDNLCKANVKEKLEELHKKGYEMYVATATEYIYAEKGITSNGLKPYFKEIFTPDTINSSKHHIKYFENILKKLNCNGNDIIFFDDSMYANALANQLGFRTVAVYDKKTEAMEENIKISDFYIENFDEIDDNILE